MENLLAEIITGLSANMAFKLGGAAVKMLKTGLFGSEEQLALNKVFLRASERFTEELLRDMNLDQAESVRDAFDQFFSNPKVTQAFVGVALKGGEPALPYKQLQSMFVQSGFDPQSLPINFDVALTVFIKVLVFEIDAQAMRKGSAIANWVSIGLLRASVDIQNTNLDFLKSVDRNIAQIAEGQAALQSEMNEISEQIANFETNTAQSLTQLERGIGDHRLRNSQYDGFAFSGMEIRISQLSTALSKEKDDAIERARDLYRGGEKTESWSVLEAILNDSNWENFEAPLRAKAIRVKATWLLNDTEDVEEAKNLIDKAREIDPSSITNIVEAHFLLQTSGIDAAISFLPDPVDIHELNFKTLLVLIKNGALEAKKLFDIYLEKYEADAETYRLWALIYLFIGNATNALKFVSLASQEQPDWVIVKRTCAQVYFYLALVGDMRPSEMMSTPDPVPPELVRSDPEGLRFLRTSQELFSELLTTGKLSKRETAEYKIWQFASLVLDKNKADEAEILFEEAIRDCSSDPRLLIWAAAVGNEVPADISIENVLEDESLNIEKIDAASRYLLGTGEIKRARKYLEKAKAEYSKTGNDDGFHLRWVQLLACEGKHDEAQKSIANISDPKIRDQLKLITLESDYQKTKDPVPLLDFLLQTYKKTNDARFLFDYCERAAGLGQWSDVADNSFELISKIPSAQTLRLCVFSNWNSQRYAECLRLIKDNAELHEGGVLPVELVRMKIVTSRIQGEIEAALSEAKNLIKREPSVENTLVYLDALLAQGNMDLLVGEAQILVDRPGVSAGELLRIVRLTRAHNMNFARTAWRRAIELIDDQTDPNVVAEAFMSSFELNLEDETNALHSRLAKLDAKGTSPFQSVSLTELAELQKGWNKNNEFVNEKYAKGEIPAHFVAENLHVPLAEIYHGIPLENRATNTPASTTTVFFRHGGKKMSDEEIVSIASKNIHVDLSALFMSEDMEILDMVISEFGQLYTSTQLPVAISSQVDQLGPLQPSRRKINEIVLRALSKNMIQCFSKPFEQPVLSSKFEHQVGPSWMELINQVKASDGYLVEFLPLTTNDLSISKIDRVPKKISRHLVNARTVIHNLQKLGLITRDESRIAFKKMGSEGNKSTKKTTLPASSKIFFHYNTISSIVECELFEKVCETYTVFVDPRFVEHAQGSIKEDDRRKDMRNWLIEFQSKIHRFIEAGSIRFFPEPFIDTKGAKGIGGSVENQVFQQLTKLKRSNQDMIWVDDRWFNGFSHCDQSPIISIYEMLLFLKQQKKITKRQFFAIIQKMRSSNYRYIPITSEEITFHLKQSSIVEGAVVETSALKTLRRYVNACLLDPLRLQRPPRPEGSANQYGETLFLSDCFAAIGDALVQMWSNYPIEKEEIQARSQWILDSLYTGSFGTSHLHPGDRSIERDLELQGLDVTSFYSKALALPMNIVSIRDEESPFNGFCTWINSIIASNLFEANPNLAAQAAAVLSNLYQHQDSKISNSEKEQRAWRFMGQNLFFALPDPVKEKLVEDKQFLDCLKITVGPSITVGSLEFEPSPFWIAIFERLKGKNPKLMNSNGDKTFSLEIVSDKDNPNTKMELIGENGETETIAHPVLDIIRIDSEIGIKLKGKYRDWFDCDQKTLEKAVDDICQISDVAGQVEAIEKWRQTSTSSYYKDLEQKLIIERSFSSEDLLPPSASALLRHYRLSEFDSEKEPTSLNLDEISVELTSVEGLQSTLNRLSCLPCPLPKHIITLILSMGNTEQGKLIEHLQNRWHSPVHLVHLAEILGQLTATDKKFMPKLIEVCCSLMDADFGSHFLLFQSLLKFSYESFSTWQKSRHWHSSTRLLISWAHASRLQNIFYTAQVPTSVRDDIEKVRKRTSPKLIFEIHSVEACDILHPEILSKELICVHGLANVLNPVASALQNCASDIFPSEILIQELQGKIYPVNGLMFNPMFATNVCGSFLGGDRQEPLISLGITTTGTVLSNEHTKTAVEMAVTELAKSIENPEVWATLFLYQQGLPIHSKQKIRFEKLVSKIDILQCWKGNREAAEISLKVLSEQVKWSSAENHRENLLDGLLAIAQEIEISNENTSETDNTKNSASLLQIVECGLQASIELDNPEKSSRNFAEFMVQLYRRCPSVLEFFGARLLHFASTLPTSQLRNLWPMILEARARY